MKKMLWPIWGFLAFQSGPGVAQGLPPEAGQILFHAMWNDQYLYIAVQVDDPNVVGTHGQLMSEVWNDDDVEVFIETDHARSPILTERCFRLAASARGGAGVSFYQGSQGQWIPNPRLGGLKLEVAVQGTLNQPADQDRGYTVEIGIPWEMLGGQPPRDRYLVGFNLVSFRRGEQDAFYSYAPAVQTEEQLNQPSAWARLLFKKTPLVRPAERDTLTCIWTDTIPIIDGRLGVGEWKVTGRTRLALSADRIHPASPPRKPTLGPPTPPPRPPFPPERRPYAGENLVLAPYYYWYQGDERHPSLPAGRLRYPDGRSQLSLKPLAGAGPWFSTLRVGWHRQQLSEVRQADIDVLLPVFWADSQSRREWSIPGLISMVMAIRELDREQREYPLVGMYLATESLQREAGQPLDLDQPAHRALFYGAIREFFWHIPPPYRAVVTDGSQRDCIVALSSPESLARIDDSVLQECEARFQKDFGTGLIWIASPAWQTLGLPSIDGYASLVADLEPHRYDSGRLALASLSPGYDNTALEGVPPQIRSRMAGQTIKEDADRVLAQPVNWLILTDWNHYETGSNLAPSREFGVRYVDLSALCALQFNGGLERDAKYISHTTPAKMMPGGTYQVELRLTNAGFTHWTPEQNIFVSYRWYKDGRLVEEEGERTGPLAVRQSHSKTLWATVKAARKDGTPLEEGLYELRWDLVAEDIQWFSLRGDRYFSVPVEVTTLPSYAGSILATDALVRLETGRTYPVRVRLRNEGVLPWQGVSLGYEWEQIACPRPGESEGEPLLVPSPDPPEPLPPVEPGAILEYPAHITVAQADGTPWPPSGEGSPHLFLRWYLVGADGQRLPSLSGPPYRELVQVIPRDFGVAFGGGTVPNTMSAGQIVEARPVLQNTGFVTWQPEEMSLSYHWYYWDGTEAEWEGRRTPLPQPLESGRRLAVPMPIQAPPYPGQYSLVLDLLYRGEIWTSHAPSTYSRDLAVIPVVVKGGPCLPVDLRKVFNEDGLSFDLNRADGSFDESGHTFPAESLPPDVAPPGMAISEDRLYPCGYWGPLNGVGWEADRRIPFRYPSKLDGEKNVVACEGQKVTFPPGRYVRLHLLGAAIAPDSKGTFLLHYREDRPVELTMSSWEAPPLHGEHVAYRTSHRHRPEGDEVDRPAYLFHYVLELDASQPLQSLTLPHNRSMRLLALTLEQPTGPEK